MLSLSEARFYDAHEDLEEIWFPRRFENDDEVKLLKGFINAAVSFELRKKGREKASAKVWKNYIKYLPLLKTINSKYNKQYQEIALHVDKISYNLQNLIKEENDV